MEIEMLTPDLTIIALTKPAVLIAREIQAAFKSAQVFCPRDVAGKEEVIFEKLGPILRTLYTQGRPIVGVCASGILIRTLAPVILNKVEEPPVIAVSLDKSYVIPLLGGHRGANKISHFIASALKGVMVSTTSSETITGFALDDPPKGWVLSPKSNTKSVSKSLINGKPVRLKIEAGDGSWLNKSNLWNKTGMTQVTLSDLSNAKGDVIIRPKTLVIGVGCERGAIAENLILLAEDMIKTNNLAKESIACIASIDLKADEEAMRAISGHFGVALRLFDSNKLKQETPRLSNPSDIVYREVGCYGVAEGAALAAAGEDSILVAEKRKGIGVTCAIARASDAIDIENVGQGLGKLTIVGIGPGHKDWLTPAVFKALIEAKHHVGYSLYLDLISGLGKYAKSHTFPLGSETERAKAALDLASASEDTVLVCSGDSGVYGMASLVFELMDHQRQTNWQFVEVIVEPGISAMQAAAARSGAPLGHDFCAISLSDLLTPWSAIQKRLEAAAEADFVISLYNPAGKNRRKPLEKALKIIENYRDTSCPVVVGRCVGRENEKMELCNLGSLNLNDIDMFTVIIIGNSETRLQNSSGRSFVYTPRGYKQTIRKKNDSPFHWSRTGRT